MAEPPYSEKDYFAGVQHPSRTATLDDHPDIKGFDPSEPRDAQSLLSAMASLGFQASNLAQAFEILKAMRRESATIFFAFTGNMITSGLRDVICYLVKNKFVDVLVTNAGGVEEDIIKSFKPFKLGSFSVPGKMLFDEGIHRTGNIFIPTDRYTALEQFLSPTLDAIFDEKEHRTIIELTREIGLRLDKDDSVLTWAAKNNIPVFCPGIQDGAIGEFFYFRKNSKKQGVLDIADELKQLNDISLNAEKTGAIILGAGISKHFTLLGNILRDGLDYCVMINTAQEFDGSDSGARPDEAITWAKINTQALSVKVHCDATIAFPLLVTAWVQGEQQL